MSDCKYRFQVVETLAQRVVFEGSQPDCNRFLAKARWHAPTWATLQVQKIRLARPRPVEASGIPATDSCQVEDALI